MKKTILGIMICVMTLGLLTGCGSSSVSVNLTDYITINCTGTDGSGTATVDFDFTQLEKDLVGDDDDNISQEEFEKLDDIAFFESSIACEL